MLCVYQYCKYVVFPQILKICCSCKKLKICGVSTNAEHVLFLQTLNARYVSTNFEHYVVHLQALAMLWAFPPYITAYYAYWRLGQQRSSPTPVYFLPTSRGCTIFVLLSSSPLPLFGAQLFLEVPFFSLRESSALRL